MKTMTFPEFCATHMILPAKARKRRVARQMLEPDSSTAGGYRNNKVSTMSAADSNKATRSRLLIFGVLVPMVVLIAVCALALRQFVVVYLTSSASGLGTQADIAKQLTIAHALGNWVAIISLAAGVIALLLTAWVFKARVARPLADASHEAEQISQGDLHIENRQFSDDDVGLLHQALHVMKTRLSGVISGIREGAHDVSDSAEQVAQGNVNLSQRTQEQASSLEEIASTMEEMTETVNHNADNAARAKDLAGETNETAQKSLVIVSSTIGAMAAIEKSNKKIADIITVIQNIAFQTNLLALNAAVEAARAGEHGRGFAVVASEVRDLAGRSANAAKEIKELIDDSVSKVEDGSNLIDETGEALSEITNAVENVSGMIAEIAAASKEQSIGIGQVNRAILQMDEMTQSNASLVEEAAAASEALGAQAEKLASLVSFFSLDETAKSAGYKAIPDNSESARDSNDDGSSEHSVAHEQAKLSTGHADGNKTYDADDEWKDF